jgi:hypothetical protein
MNAADLRAITDASVLARQASNQAEAQALVDSFLDFRATSVARDGGASADVCVFIVEGADRPYKNTVSTVANTFASEAETPEVSQAVAEIAVTMLDTLGFDVFDEEYHYPSRRLRVTW